MKIKLTDQKNESILDGPKPELDRDVWALNADGEYVLTIQADEKIGAVVKWAVEIFGITDPIVHVTGSIGSNSYGDDSDIDVHFCSETFKPKDVDEFNRGFREAFAAQFDPSTGSDIGVIGSHPVEVYFQTNPYQDMMSVGCYDYFKRKWECGPDVKDTAFDPYSEYYENDMKYVGRLANDIRNQILDVYEKALVIQKSSSPKFKDALFAKMLKSLDSAAKLFTAIRNKRKVMSSPKSKKQALEMRKSRKWHIADSAFKLFDRFGYLGILRSYTQLSEKAAEGEPDIKEYVDAAIKAVTDGITGNKMLSDSELTEGEVPGMAGWDDSDLRVDICGWLDERVEEYQLDIEIIDIALHGSRTRKDFRPDSDLDVIVYYRGKPGARGGRVKEDHIWNMLNDEPKCEIDGVEVDFWPIRDEESGSLDDVLARNRAFDAERGKLDEANMDEGFGSVLRNTALAGLMLAPGAALAKSADRQQSAKPAVVQAARREKKFGNLSESNMRNLLATIAYNETMLDWIKYKDDNEIIAVLNTIDNRAGGDPSNYAFVIGEKSQYFSAKHVKGGYSDATYTAYDPNDEAKAEGGQLSRLQKECWRLCQRYAQQLLDGKLKNVIGDRNMIGNREKDTDRTAIGDGGWGAQCDIELGGQQFGYQSKWDGYRRFGKKKPSSLTHVSPAKANYVVKAGDTLWNIAKANKTTVQKIRSANGLKSDTIRPGQKLII